MNQYANLKISLQLHRNPTNLAEKDAEYGSYDRLRHRSKNGTEFT
jgi:hypothetical protein